MHLTLKMTSAQVVSHQQQNYPHPGDHTIRTTDTLQGYQPMNVMHQLGGEMNRESNNMAFELSLFGDPLHKSIVALHIYALHITYYCILHSGISFFRLRRKTLTETTK